MRHGERADSSFDDWCLSEDAAMYPHDPPLTAKGIQQSEKLALALEELLYAELINQYTLPVSVCMMCIDMYVCVIVCSFFPSNQDVCF